MDVNNDNDVATNKRARLMLVGAKNSSHSYLVTMMIDDSSNLLHSSFLISSESGQLSLYL